MSNNKIKYSLVGIDGNAFAIMGYTTKCMKRENKSKSEINNYMNKATSSNYDHLVSVSLDIIDDLNNSLS